MNFVKSLPGISETMQLVGSWTVSVGDQDQALHLWKFTGGFESIDTANAVFAENQVSFLFCFLQ